MVDLNMLIPAMITILVTFITGSCILNASGRKTAQRQKDAYAQIDAVPEHYWVDDSASFGAWVLTLLVFLVGSITATSLLFH